MGKSEYDPTLQGAIDRRLQETQEEGKTDWSQHLIGGIIAIGIVLLVAFLIYSYLVADEDYKINTDDGLRIARARDNTITPYIDVFSQATVA